MRDSVDVVVPFHGSADRLVTLLDRLERLALKPGDTVTVVDNTKEGVARRGSRPGIRILHAPERQSSYFARNRGAAVGTASWIVFIDADVEAPPNLLDGYLASPPADDVGVLVGDIEDVVNARDAHETLAERYARLRRPLDQRNTLDTAWPYAQTANCAVRRTAFVAVGGFPEDVRSGGDADLCFRLREGAWRLEAREAAKVKHWSRNTLSGFLRQRARHGAGAEWLAARYPGFVAPRARTSRLLWNMVRGIIGASRARLRGDRDDTVLRLVDPLSIAAFEVGRRMPNSIQNDGKPIMRLIAALLR